MDNVKKILVGIATGVGAVAVSVGHAFAQTPPVMDTDVQTGILSIVTGMKDTIFANILAVLPLAGLVLVTLMGIRWLFGTFHRVARA